MSKQETVAPATKDNATPWCLSGQPWQKKIGQWDQTIKVAEPAGRVAEGFVVHGKTSQEARDRAALIVKAVNGYDKFRAALEHAMRDAKSRRYSMPVTAAEIDREIIDKQIDIYRAALAE